MAQRSNLNCNALWVSLQLIVLQLPSSDTVLHYTRLYNYQARVEHWGEAVQKLHCVRASNLRKSCITSSCTKAIDSIVSLLRWRPHQLTSTHIPLVASSNPVIQETNMPVSNESIWVMMASLFSSDCGRTSGTIHALHWACYCQGPQWCICMFWHFKQATWALSANQEFILGK